MRLVQLAIGLDFVRRFIFLRPSLNSRILQIEKDDVEAGSQDLNHMAQHGTCHNQNHGHNG